MVGCLSVFSLLHYHKQLFLNMLPLRGLLLSVETYVDVLRQSI